MPKRPSLTMSGRIVFGILLSLAGWVNIAHAQVALPAGTEQMIQSVISNVILALNMGTWVLFVILNYLLDPSFIFAFGGTLMDILNHIWMLSRDLMNLVFAVILIGVAIYTIVTAKKDFLSQYGSKFVVAVVLVNFSWFLPRLVIDVANVGAAAVYGIPSLLFNVQGAQCRALRSAPPNPPAPGCIQIGQSQDFNCPCKVITNAEFFIQSDVAIRNLQQMGYNCTLAPVVCYKEDLLNQATVAGHSAILNGLVINHGRLGQLAVVPAPGAGEPVQRTVTFLMRMVLLLAIHIALFFPLLAMAVVFFIRIPVLWLTIAFMPFYFLDFLLGNERLTHGVGKKILDNFLKAAFLPMIVAAPLSAGLLLLNAGAVLEGGPMSAIPIQLFQHMGNFWQLLWLMMGLGVLWVGTFAALRGNDIMSAGVESIKQYGESLGKIALKAPLAARVIPGTSGMGGGGGGITALGLMRRFDPRSINATLNSGQSLEEVLGGRPNEAEAAAKRLRAAAGQEEAINKLVRGTGDVHRDLRNLATILRDHGGLATATGDTAANDLQRIRAAGGLRNLDEAQFQDFRRRAAAAGPAPVPAPAPAPAPAPVPAPGVPPGAGPLP